MTGLLRCVLLLGLMGTATCSGDDEGGTWEWSGVFPFEAEEHTFMLQKTEGEYADPAIMFSYHSAPSGDQAGIDANVEKATELWAGDAIDVVYPLTAAYPFEVDVLYNLVLDESVIATFIRLPAPSVAGNYAFFMQHFPIEFEEMAHYLVDSSGADVEPLAEGGVEEEEDDSSVLGQSIAANLLVSLVSLTGILVLMPFPCWKGGNFSVRRFMMFTSSFATGTLLAAAFFLILPEALLNIQEGTEAYNALVFGASTLSGFALGALLHWGLRFITNFQNHEDVELYAVAGGPPVANAVKDTAVESGKADIEAQEMLKTPAGAASVTPPREKSMKEHQEGAGGLCEYTKWASVAWSVLIGDFFHNIVDGVAISLAFKLCNPYVGWIVAMGAVAHELPTELSDYMVLVTQGKMKPSAALFWNLVSGLSCLIAGIIAAYVPFDNQTTGGLLAFSGGVYLWVACEVFPMALKTKSSSETAISASLLIGGFILVGLVLLVHEHCAAGHGH